MTSTALPDKVRMTIATGMLESLGLNMYTSIGKSLAEFVANAYDADATNVEIKLPFDDIELARRQIRAAEKKKNAKSSSSKKIAVYSALPEDITISITDDGHGMSPEDMEKKFLYVSRNRRLELGSKTRSGKRFVMGRKGLGKLAGFGAAEKLTVYSKQAGENFACEFCMDYAAIQSKAHTSLEEVAFDLKYHRGKPLEEHGTKVTLSRLRCDSLKSSEATVLQSLAISFGVLGNDFSLRLNGEIVKELESIWEYTYPEACDADGFGAGSASIDDDAVLAFRYKVRFRARDADAIADGDARGTGSLPANLRGARIYCSGRLAAGPSLLSLETGMHNFHSQSYMECVVHADELDQQEIDYIGTNRADLKSDNLVVDGLYKAVTECMRKALYEHSKYRESAVARQLEQDAVGKGYLGRISQMSGSVKKSARKVLTTLATVHGTQSELFKELAPIVLDSMNAGEVLTKLIEIESNPASLRQVIDALRDLAEVETKDALKLYRGRSRAIHALETLVQRATSDWKGARFEKDLHLLLKGNPWLLHPKYGQALTSDKPMSELLSKLNLHLKIEDAAFTMPTQDDEESDPRLQERPDLVFLVSDGQTPTYIDIVELKSPNIPLTSEHLEQLLDYRQKVVEWMRTELGRDVTVYCYLVGERDYRSNALGVQRLKRREQEDGLTSGWKLLTLQELLANARTMHLEAIKACEAEELNFEE